MSHSLTLAGSVCVAVGLLGYLLLRVRTGNYRRWVAAWYLMADAFFYPADILTHNRTAQLLDAAFGAYWAWVWWNAGGGDDTKRRLRKLARKFTPVRRTAPATS
jgi:hypothetical protein